MNYYYTAVNLGVFDSKEFAPECLSLPPSQRKLSTKNKKNHILPRNNASNKPTMSLNKTNVEFLTHGHILEFPTYHTTTATPGRAHQTHPHRGGIEMKVEGFHTLNPLLHAE